MSTQEMGKRTSLTYTKKAHARLKAMCKELKVTQPDIVNILLENISIEAIRPHAAKIVAARDHEAQLEKEKYDKLRNLTPDQLNELLARL